MLKGIKSFIPIGWAVCLTVLLGGISQAEIMGVDHPDHEYLHYDLSDDAIFIKNTTSDPDTIAEIEFSLYFDDNQYKPDGYMSIIQFKFTYDPDKAILITDSWNKYNWDGDSSLSDQPYGDDRIVTVSLSNAQENYDAPTSSTHYITVRFKVPCMAETDNVPLQFSGTSWDNIVVMTDEDRYEPSSSDPDNTDDGLIEVNDYTASFSIPEADLDCGALGKSVSVPVYATTNFYPQWIYHAIWYDNDKLNFDSLVFGVGLWTFPSVSESANNDSVYVSLLLVDHNYAHQFDNEVLYYLYFTVLYPPEGDNWIGQTTVPDFDEDTCFAYPWGCGYLV